MSSWTRISRDDLIHWADVDGARELPELVRRLVLETGDSIEKIDVPGGTGVALGGHDGFVRAANGKPYVPAGASVWELSVKKSAPRKADEDYAKRIDVPDGSPTTQATYIQLICRPWTAGRAWAKDRSADGRWREVRSYNVDTLTTWLEQAPATRLWFLEMRGRSPVGITTASTWWARWANQTEPALSPDLVLARQRNELEALNAAIRRPGVTTVAGAIGGDEIIACVVASAVAADDDVLGRTVVIHDEATWRRLLAEPSPMVLVAADTSLLHEVDSTTVHTVMTPVPHSDDGDIILSRLDSDVVVDALRAADDSLPYDLGALARRSLVALRRRLASRPMTRPTWASTPTRAVRATVLMTSWDDRNEADRTTVAALIGTPYEDVREQLLVLTHGDDPLVTLNSHHWHVVSPLDAWLLLGIHLLADDITRFIEQATQVLSERDPALSMPRTDRWRASLDGKTLAYSHQLRRGVATGLALLGAYGDSVTSGSGMHGEIWAGRAIRPLLDAANRDPTGDLWASVADVLPLLMEAAPREVLDAVRVGASSTKPVLSTIFQDDRNEQALWEGSSPHIWFVWAMERAAWSGEHLAAASEMLARLAALDPGGRLSNRPRESLENIYCGWHPDTAADQPARVAVIDWIRPRWPDTAWSLMVSLLPNPHGIHHPTAAPDFRDWKPGRRPVLIVDHQQMVYTVLDRLLEDVGIDVDRWGQLLKAHCCLAPEMREKVRNALASVDADRLDDDDRRNLWNRVRAITSHHREYSDTQWAMPSGDLAHLDAIAERIIPPDPAQRHSWLFANDRIELGDLRRRDDFAAYDAEVSERRTAAITEIVASAGIQAAAQFPHEVRFGLVGVALANAYEDDYLEVMLGWLYEDEPRATIASNYLWCRSRNGGVDWALKVLAEHPELDAEVQARLLHDVEGFRSGLEAAQKRGSDVERKYWERFVYVGRGSDFPDVLIAAEQLGRVGRWAAALDMLALYSRRNESTGDYGEAVACAFEGFIDAGGDDPETAALASWDFEQIFQILDMSVGTVGLDRVTRIQWYFFPVLGFDPPTTTLHRRLADDPAFFVEMTSFVYGPRTTGQTPSDPGHNKRLPENAHHLLDSWTVPPGLDSAGRFDAGRCEAWIDEATRLLDEADRVVVGRLHIGQILTYTPSGDEGWPGSTVAALIERLDDDNVDAGVRLRIRNRRGVTTRSMTEGGNQERVLAAEYQARAARFTYASPRVARILDGIAQEYKHEAMEHDADAERRRRGLDT